MNNPKKNFPFVSIIIPTFNRSKTLEKSLNLFFKQDYPKDKTEIVVIDDGSSDNTNKTVKNIKIKLPKKIRLKYLFQKNKGPSVARNLGINNCQGSIVIIVNDDTLPVKEFITEHVKFHFRFPKKNFGVLGFTTWSPEIKITPFMRWLENGGPLFSYNQIKGVKINWQQGWTCNISYKKEFLLENGLFDEDFPFAAWEDIELAYRLFKKGMEFRYNKNAIGYHYHPTTLKSSIRKMNTQGISVVIFGGKIKEKSVLPPLAKKDLGGLIDLFDRIFILPPIEYLLKRIALFCESRFICYNIYNLLLLHYRVLGRREFLKRQHVKKRH